MIGNETKVFRFLLFAFLLLSALFACKDLFGPLDNPVDRESENYQGYPSTDDPDKIEALKPSDSEKIRGESIEFFVSKVVGADSYQLQISTSRSDFSSLSLVFDKATFISNEMTASAINLPGGTPYYWRARAKKNGNWGNWTSVSSFFLGYKLTYDGNTNESGTVPTDIKAYLEGDTVTILGNTGNLAKTGYSFSGWNTKPDGSGTSYQAGASFTMGSSNVTLYAKWNMSGLLATGYNGYGQLGDGTTNDKYTPVKVIENVKVVSAGASHTMIIKNDNSLWATGHNAYGQLGDGTTIDKSTPLEVMEDVKAVSAGANHTMIIKNDNSLWATGYNAYGQLGDSTTIDKSTPVKVMENVKAVAAGAIHTMIIKNDNSLWATGHNGYGELGDATIINQSTPIEVMEDVKAVSAGYSHTMIIKNDGSLWATGYNGYGQLGDWTTINKSTPVQIMEDVQAIAAGAFNTMIIKNDGSLWATGYNAYGQLGDGTTINKSVPIEIIGDVQAVAAGDSYTMILK